MVSIDRKDSTQMGGFILQGRRSESYNRDQFPYQSSRKKELVDSRERKQRDTTEPRVRMLLQRRPHIAGGFPGGGRSRCCQLEVEEAQGLSKGSNHPCKLHEQVAEVRGLAD